MFLHRAHAARALAALLLAALVAGCGSSGGGSTGGSAQVSDGASATPAPAASAAGGLDTQLAGGAAASGTKAAGTLAHQSQPGITHTKQAKLGTSHHSVTHVAVGKVVSGSGVGKITTNSTPATTSTASTPPPTTTSTAATPPPTHTTAQPTTRTVTVVRTRTVVHTITRTRANTNTRTVRPDVPVGAFLPSTHPALLQRTFTVPGGNIGCQLSGTGVRCQILHRVWTSPKQPRSCHGTWGSMLLLAGSGRATFMCGRHSSLASGAKVVPDGWDDTIGTVTCQVRSFGVDCFAAKHHGFLISRTGYTLY